jgi:hypothetical protein
MIKLRSLLGMRTGAAIRTTRSRHNGGWILFEPFEAHHLSLPVRLHRMV